MLRINKSSTSEEKNDRVAEVLNQVNKNLIM